MPNKESTYDRDVLLVTRSVVAFLILRFQIELTTLIVMDLAIHSAQTVFTILGSACMCLLCDLHFFYLGII